MSMERKNAGIRIRVARELRDAFSVACHSQNSHPSEVIREFMKQYVLGTLNGSQLPLPLAKRQ